MGEFFPFPFVSQNISLVIPNNFTGASGTYIPKKRKDRSFEVKLAIIKN